MIKAQLFEVSSVPAKDPSFTLKLEMMDLDDYIPRMGEKFVMLTFKEYEELTGKKPEIKMKPKKVIVERLPTVGEPLSIKTKSAGRVGSMKENKNELLEVEQNSRRSKYRHSTLTVLKANAKRIIEFKNSSPRQKEAARQFLEKADSELDPRHASLIEKIVRTLSRTFKEF